MAAYSVLLLLCICIHSIISQAGTAIEKSVLVPHTADKGYVLARVPWEEGQSSSVESDLADLFGVLEGGHVITTSDISRLVQRTLPLMIKHELGTKLWHDTIHIRVYDTSESPLIFQKTEYSGTIKENLPVGSLVQGVSDLRASTGLDKDDLEISYDIVSGDMGRFDLVSKLKNGIREAAILTTKMIDREDREKYMLVIESMSGDFTAQTTVTITVRDEDDTPPSFPKTEYSVDINYAVAEERESILCVTATDLDIGPLRYMLMPNTVFDVDQGGNLYLKARGLLRAKQYVLELIALDPSNHTTIPTRVTINVNHDLKFKPSHHRRVRRQVTSSTEILSVNENETAVYTFTTEDPGTQASYSIVSSSVELFRMVGRTLALLSGRRLDYENAALRSLTVVVDISNNGVVRETRTIQINVQNVNDEPPYFVNEPEPYLAVVSPTTSAGTVVYTLRAVDPDGDLAHVKYILRDAVTADSRFSVNQNDGSVSVIGDGTFPLRREYFIDVAAQDTNANPLQTSIQKTVQIIVGARPPQIFEPRYDVNVPEEASTPYTVVTVKARTFQNYPLRYTLLDSQGDDPSFFSITSDGNEGGEVKLLTTLNYESTVQPKEYNMRVVVSELSNDPMSSTVELRVSVMDVNDNAPSFQLSTYTRKDVSEDVPQDYTLLNVTASDRDSGQNAELTFTVDNPLFAADSIGNTGIIKVAGRLDYDRTQGHRYEFLVYAMDHGESPRSGSATVIIFVTNVNDEDPEFSTDLVTEVVENAGVNHFVHTVQVTDPDGDNVLVYFDHPRTGVPGTVNGPFQIIPNTGRVTLRTVLPRDVLHYALNMTAVDDGSCCNSPVLVQRSSQAVLVVKVLDINDNRPEFPNCTIYQQNPPEVLEHSPIGMSVFQVVATDADQGDNGKIAYSLLRSGIEPFKFTIAQVTGVISVNQDIDREGTSGARDIGITVQANDHGDPPLNGICSFRILVVDINDHAPVFSQSQYTASISRNMQVGSSVIRVVADDQDAGDNRLVEYSLTNNAGGMFKIYNETGVVRLDASLQNNNQMTITVMAQDHGKPNRLNSTATVVISVTTNIVPPPVWQGSVADNEPIRVNETHTVSSFSNAIARLRATTSNLDNVNFLFIVNQRPTPSNPPFNIYRPPGREDEMDIVLNSQLDFEKRETYELKIRASANSAISDISVRVEVIDENDEVPGFTGFNSVTLTLNGSLTENKPSGQTVARLQALDDDKSEAFRQLRYSFYGDTTGEVEANFTINHMTGVITTKVVFDLEAFPPPGVIRFRVKVDDTVSSALPGLGGSPNSATAVVEVVIVDENDNKPHFTHKLWNATVLEDVDRGTPVLTLSATDDDKDSQMEYSIISGGNDFTVDRRSGIIRVAQLLDFEDPNRRVYNLTVQVFDGIFDDQAFVIINVLDANDNDPVFDLIPYTVTNITEEQSEGLPMILIQVHATDPDIDRPNDIEYSLNGRFAADNTFIIEPKSGVIRVTKPLDRDAPNGQRVYEFNVLAVDEPFSNTKRTGVTYVQVYPIDINDNAPIFKQDQISGSVPEHTIGNSPGSSVFAVRAEDADEGKNAEVVYRIVSGPESNGLPLFSINSVSGEIYVSTMDSSALDRELQDKYSLTIEAKDKGAPPMSSEQLVTIELDDINDQSPEFSQSIYQVSMSESYPRAQSIISVTASDHDIGINAQLIYSLETNRDKEFFYIESRNLTNEGILRVYLTGKIDYENPALRFFNVTIGVDDVPAPSHKVLAYVEVTVEDYNDNAPEFISQSESIHVYENISVNTFLASFIATDRDSGINAEFDYYIDHGPESDPHHQFKIDVNGTVRLNKPLDRETADKHDVVILAIDKGTPPQTGSALLAVDVLDVNDNAPKFAKDYVVYFEENFRGVQTWPELIKAEDADTPEHGAPFTFTLPCNYRCPCGENPTCDSFNMTFMQVDSTDSNGAARIFTMDKTFDREDQAEYAMPIIMWDSGNPVMTGTNYLPIIIKDENDNPHKPGLKKIFVYSYAGFNQLQDIRIGRVYAEDPDDWDLPDKTFEPAGTLPTFFSVAKDDGMVRMSGTPPEGIYSFKVNVYDRVFDKSVESEVEVTVKELSEEAVYSSGSVRLTGISARDFVERPHNPSGDFGDYDASKYDKFKAEIASMLNTAETNVEVFSVRDNKGSVDVRFAARGSPWYKPTKLNGLIRDKNAFGNKVGVTIGMMPIDECIKEICDHGCYNEYIVGNQPKVVFGNTTSFVGVDSYLQADCNECNGTSSGECTCKAGEFPDTCRHDFCFNEGTCFIDDWGEMKCKCRAGFNGLRCQETRHSFSGNGWALYPALAQCEYGRTSLEFITRQANGLLFYNGPMDTDGELDFISLELIRGNPRLRINHGTGTLTLPLNNQNLDDDKWHRIDITSEQKLIKLIVDNCASAVISEDGTGSTEDRSSCETSGTTPGENMFLNVNNLLQMGGTMKTPPYPTGGLTQDFDGCIKNFRHLGMLYDLHIGETGLQEGTEDGCPREDVNCGVNNVNGLECGDNGICEGGLTTGSIPKCVCKPGWKGGKCTKETPIKDFRTQSFMIWGLRSSFLNSLDKYKNKFQLNFRSRDESGVLFSVMSESKTEFITLEIISSRLQLSYHLGSQVTHVLHLPKVIASNGQWHTAYMERYGKQFLLYMDSGEGPYYAETLGPATGHRSIDIAQNNVFGGARISGTSVEDPQVSDLENSCMNDVRMEGDWFPMETGDTSSSAATLNEARNVDNNCIREDCETVVCPDPNQICVPLWERHVCRCKPGYAEGNVSMPCVTLCFCLHGGTCRYNSDGYFCDCPPDYTGPNCETNVLELTKEASLSAAGLAVILVCFLVLLVLVLAVFLYLRLRKPKEKLMMEEDPYDDIRENIVNYDEEGAGEEDQNAFDISRIRVPVDAGPLVKPQPYEDTPRRTDIPIHSSLPPGEAPDVGNFIHSRLKDADDDYGAPPHDSVREFVYEGGGSDAGSLSSLNTSTSSGDQDYDYLNEWGPKFAKLADMYGAGQEADED